MHEFVLHIPELANSLNGYNFLEDLLKIGLPSLVAIISAFISYKIFVHGKQIEKEINNINHKNEKEKYMLDRKIQTIELASDKLEDFFVAIGEYFGSVSGILKLMKESPKEWNEFSSTHKQLIKEKDGLLMKSWSTRNYAISRFRIIGADEVITALGKINKLVNEVREEVLFRESIPIYEEFNNKADEFMQLKNNLYVAINKFYNN